MRQVAGGAADMATGGLIQFMERIRTRLDDDLQYCERELQNVRTSASRFGPPGPVQHLMGQVQSVRQNRIDALVKEKEQAKGQCDQMATVQTNAQREIGQLRASNDQLQKDNDKLRQELLVARATPRPSQLSSVSSGSSTRSGLTDQEQIRQSMADNKRIRGEREALRKDNEKLKTANAEWKANARREKLRNDSTIDRLLGQLQEAEDKLKQSQGQPSSRLPSHREMGGHRPCLPVAEGRTSLPTTSTEMLGPSALPPSASQPAHLGATSSPQTSQLAPQCSASATSQGPFDKEEDMESDSQAGSGSGR